MSVKSSYRQHNPQALLVGLPQTAAYDLERTLAAIAIKTNSTTQDALNEGQLLVQATHIFAYNHAAVEIANQFSQKKFVVAIFLSIDRALLLKFFRAGGAAALRYPWAVHELPSNLRLMFGLELNV